MVRRNMLLPLMMSSAFVTTMTACNPALNSHLSSSGNSSSKVRIGLTDTLYPQIRFSVSELGAVPVDLTTPESLNAMFLAAPRPELLANEAEAKVTGAELSQSEGYTRMRWDISAYSTPRGVLDRYIEANRAAADRPIDERFLAPIVNLNYVRQQMSQLDGLVVGGGEDVNPRLYFARDLVLPNAKGGPEDNVYARTRDIIELAYIGEALRQGKPVLGICRGSQILAVALGGRLLQDIPSEIPSLGTRHSMPLEFAKSEGHEVAIAANSIFAQIMRLDRPDAGQDVVVTPKGFVIGVNSYHHQAVVQEFSGITVHALDNGSSASTGRPVVEGFVANGTRTLVMGVQWHPERPFATQGSSVDAAAVPYSEWKLWFQSDSRRPYYRRIFENLVACAGSNRGRCIQ